jgi:RNA polymerase sigma-70 factor (ECF subfamily)
MTGDAEVFEAERPRLRALAYRMLGSMADADDVVQEVWLRWDRLGPQGQAAVQRPAAWLTTATSRRSLDVLRSAQRRREDYVGPWLPEPILTDDDPADSAVLAESLTLGFLTVLERLAPVERAVFLLVDVFGEPYPEVAAAVDRSEEACRQIASRARRRVRQEHRRTVPGRHDELVRAFLAACGEGRVDDLRRVLLDDVVLVSDGGAAVHAARRPVVGADRVARFLVKVGGRMPAGTVAEPHCVNGEPGAVLRWQGAPLAVMAFEVVGDRLAAVRLVVNPDKLRSLDPR